MVRFQNEASLSTVKLSYSDLTFTKPGNLITRLKRKRNVVDGNKLIGRRLSSFKNDSLKENIDAAFLRCSIINQSTFIQV